MNDLTPFMQNENDSPKSGTDRLVKDILIPFGSALIAAIVILATTRSLPLWATVAVVAYLTFVVVLVLAKPLSNISSKFFTWNLRRRFAKKMTDELLQLVRELSELLESRRESSMPSLINSFSSRLSDKARQLLRLDRNSRELDLIQTWTLALLDRCSRRRTAQFLADAYDFTLIVLKYSWACTYLRQDVLLTKNVEEDTSKELPDFKPDWDTARQKVSEFLSRVERFAKSINEKYGTRICADSFQEVKPL